MALDHLSSRGSAVDELADPSQAYQVFMAMDDLMDKLKVLNYDEEFLKALKMRPFSR